MTTQQDLFEQRKRAALLRLLAVAEAEGAKVRRERSPQGASYDTWLSEQPIGLTEPIEYNTPSCGNGANGAGDERTNS